MTGPNMAMSTASLERSLQNFSLNQSTPTTRSDTAAGGGGVASSESDSPENHIPNPSDATLELNSQNSLPHYWEQCLDLKTGEIYYINWRTGMKSKEDPRTTAAADLGGGDFCSEEDEEATSYDSEGSSSESTPFSSTDQHYHRDHRNNHVLVVAGCRSCLMYFMVPKRVEACPKCCGHLLHFNRSDNSSS